MALLFKQSDYLKVTLSPNSILSSALYIKVALDCLHYSVRNQISRVCLQFMPSLL